MRHSAAVEPTFPLTLTLSLGERDGVRGKKMQPIQRSQQQCK